MMLPIAALLITYALTALIALLAAVILWRPLSILLAELCGTEERSHFWTVWSTVMMVATPMVCSTSWRWVKYTPLGLPVVPVV